MGCYLLLPKRLAQQDAPARRTGGVGHWSVWLACLLMCLSWPSVCPAQTPSAPGLTDEDALLNALQKLDATQRSEIHHLLATYPQFLTPSLWDKLVQRSALAYYGRGPAHALAGFDLALEIAQRWADAKRVGMAWYQKGLVFAGAGQTAAAIQAYTAARQAFASAGAQRDQIYLLSDLSTLYLNAEAHPQAKALAEECLRLVETLRTSSAAPGAWPDAYGQAGALSTLGMLSQQQGASAQALDYLARSLALYQQLHQARLPVEALIADVLNASGRVYQATGEHAQALQHYDQALKLAEKIGRRDLQAGVRNNLGVLLLEQEDYEQAEQQLRLSLQIQQARQRYPEIARVLLNLAVCVQRRGAQPQALVLFQQLLTEPQWGSQRDVLIAAGIGLGGVYREQRRYADALAILERSLHLAIELADPTRQAELAWRQAEVYVETGDFARAEPLATQALTRARTLGQPNLAYVSATVLGRVYLGQGKTALAQQTLEQAITLVEAMRQRIVGRTEGRQLYFEQRLAPYHLLLEMLIQQQRPQEALLLAERAKGRVLLDWLHDAPAPPTRPSHPVLPAQAQPFQQELHVLNQRLVAERAKPAPDPVTLEQLRTQLNDTRQRYTAWQTLQAGAAARVHLPAASTAWLTAPDLAALASRPQTAYLEYVIARERVYLFVLTPATNATRFQVQVYPLAWSSAELRERVQHFRAQLTARRPGLGVLARELYDHLLKPAAAQLQGSQTLYLIPDGCLWELPFAALQPRAEHYLIEDAQLLSAPSLQVLQQQRQRPRNTWTNSSALLALGNPHLGGAGGEALAVRTRGERLAPLPETETEVQQLGERFPAAQRRVLLGADATEQQFKALAPTARLIHCATHGVLEPGQPLYSFLLLSQNTAGTNEDGVLEAREVLALKLNAELTVLSACETARGRIGAGEGVLGLAWAFLAAGSRATLVTQWKVASQGTAEWMDQFYQHLFDPTRPAALTSAAALRQASLHALQSPQYQHPFYWAGFVLLGDSE
jgi:CHAT domain-containing protein/tetratricopeptide (TPR) repeat protein